MRGSMIKVVQVFGLIHIVPIVNFIINFKYANTSAIIIIITCICNIIMVIYFIKTKNLKIKKYFKVYLIYLLLFMILVFPIEAYKEPFTYNEDGSVREYIYQNIYRYSLSIK